MFIYTVGNESENKFALGMGLYIFANETTVAWEGEGGEE